VNAKQHALTVVAPLRAGTSAADVRTSLKELEDPVIELLKLVPSLHFARFVVLTTPEEKPPRLAFETNYDGLLDVHLSELERALAPYEERLFGMWAGYIQGGLRRFVAAHARRASTFYLGHPGLSVRQIHDDDAVRTRLSALLDDAQRAGTVAGKSGVAIRDLLVRQLDARGPTLGAIDRGLPDQPEATIRFYAIVAGLVVLAVPWLAVARIVERGEHEEQPSLLSETDERLDAIIGHEDSVSQNGLTHHVPLRPGAFRRATMKLVLWFLEQARQTIAYKGTLGGISSIHFARWVMLDDDTVLFFSNYDGSWEAYLGDFVDKAHHYLTAVWTNTKWFPEARFLVFGGAAHEGRFKQWTRTFQVENQIWYSAYPHLTVSDVLQNARIREGAVGAMDEEEACAWLALL